eukprot:5147269-Pyramimonas_sp.AAC.1
MVKFPGEGCPRLSLRLLLCASRFGAPPVLLRVPKGPLALPVVSFPHVFLFLSGYRPLQGGPADVPVDLVARLRLIAIRSGPLRTPSIGLRYPIFALVRLAGRVGIELLAVCLDLILYPPWYRLVNLVEGLRFVLKSCVGVIAISSVTMGEPTVKSNSM